MRLPQPSKDTLILRLEWKITDKQEKPTEAERRTHEPFRISNSGGGSDYGSSYSPGRFDCGYSVNQDGVAVPWPSGPVGRSMPIGSKYFTLRWSMQTEASGDGEQVVRKEDSASAACWVNDSIGAQYSYRPALIPNVSEVRTRCKRLLTSAGSTFPQQRDRRGLEGRGRGDLHATCVETRRVSVGGHQLSICVVVCPFVCICIVMSRSS